MNVGGVKSYNSNHIITYLMCECEQLNRGAYKLKWFKIKPTYGKINMLRILWGLLCMEHLKTKAIITLILISLACCVFANTNPVVTNLDVSQREDGKLEISFDLEDEQDDLLSVAIEISDNNGRTYDVPIGLNSLMGDVGNGIEAGKSKKIVWDAIKDQPNVNSASSVSYTHLTLPTKA